MKQFFRTWRSFVRLDEGGNKSLKTRDVVLTPELVKKTVFVYEGVISDWNKWLKTQNEQPVEALKPVGSVSYYEKDLEEKPGTVYGDIDYLVEFPLDSEDANDTAKRKNQNAQKRKYTQLFVDYLNSGTVSSYVDVEETLKGNVLLVILELEQGVFVQADTVITFPDYRDWMNSRYTPERGIKGYATGHLYTSLGGFFPLSIGTEGVIARTQDGALVTGKVRKNVEINTLSTDPHKFLIDIAKYFVGDDVKIHPILAQNSGINPDNISIESFALGIKGLALTLEQRGFTNAQKMLQQISNTYKGKLQASVENKELLADKKENDLRANNYDAQYIEKFKQAEQKAVQKMLAINAQAFELFTKGIN